MRKTKKAHLVVRTPPSSKLIFCDDDSRAPSGDIDLQPHQPPLRPSHHTRPCLCYSSDNELFASSAIIHAAAISAAFHYEDELLKAACRGRFAQPHQCRSVHEVFILMAPIFCHAHCMSFDSFWCLHAILLQHITAAMDALSNYKRVGERW